MELSINTRYDVILEEFEAEKASIHKIADTIASIQNEHGYSNFVAYFQQQDMHLPTLATFKAEYALIMLKHKYWYRMFTESGALNYVSATKRSEIESMFNEPEKLPEFTEENIKPTMAGLFMDLPKLLAERVDGIFRALSRSHFTNLPQGFSERMIFVVAHHFVPYTSVNHHNCNVINDLLAVINQLKGGDATIKYDVTYKHVFHADRYGFGEWQDLGNGVRMRVYKKGTAHLEIDADVAEKLNKFLASLYPDVVADMRHQRNQHKTTRKVKHNGLDSIALAYKHIQELKDLQYKQVRDYFDVQPNEYTYTFSKSVKEILKLLQPVTIANGYASFSYDVKPVINHIIDVGTIPDYKTHQFYPTPAHIVKRAQEMLDYKEGMKVLEPSAGTGNLVTGLNKDDVTCIDVAPLFVEVLKAKGYNAIRADFLVMKQERQYNRIIMNPPFDGNRAINHVLQAWEMLEYDGKLVAILPESFKEKVIIDGFRHTYSEPLGGFDNTSIKVVIVSIQK